MPFGKFCPIEELYLLQVCSHKLVSQWIWILAYNACWMVFHLIQIAFGFFPMVQAILFLAQDIRSACAFIILHLWALLPIFWHFTHTSFWLGFSLVKPFRFTLFGLAFWARVTRVACTFGFTKGFAFSTLLLTLLGVVGGCCTAAARRRAAPPPLACSCRARAAARKGAG